MDGHYCLDLSNELDKFCLNKLLELGMTIAYRRAKNRYFCAMGTVFERKFLANHVMYLSVVHGV